MSDNASVGTAQSTLWIEDDWANSLTHGFGLLLSLIGFVFLIQIPAIEENSWKFFSFVVYGLSLITLYATSTVYHGLRDEGYKRLFRLLDHCAIYLLIAGSYTPFSLIALQGFLGWALFCTIWLLAGAGIAFKIFFIGKFAKTSTAIYLIMGWLVVIVVEPLISALPSEALYLVAAGGFSYTFGVIFFVLDKRQFFHAIWHLFVMGGSICHYLAIRLYL